MELIRHVLKGEDESRYPDTVFGILRDVEDALLRLESLVIHRAANNDVEDTLHTLKRIIDRIFRTQTRIKKEAVQAS
ncbi:MAG: hypothetical protein P1Q69_13465 [Candidatus Thorarchaeota archaeon]|nr:hypothetical protein [Candidatus Thorarchaeota archaeon]